MALELAGNVGNLFLNSKYNNEGLTQRQTKIVKIIKPGCTAFKGDGSAADFDKSDGRYNFLSSNYIIFPFSEIPNGATLINAKVTGTFAGTWTLYVSGAIIASGTQNQQKKINKLIVDDSLNWVELSGTNGEVVITVQLEYTI